MKWSCHGQRYTFALHFCHIFINLMKTRRQCFKRKKKVERERIIEASLCWSWLYAVFPFSERFRECGSFNYFSARYLAKPSLNSFYVRYILPNLPFLIEYYLSWFIMKGKRCFI